MNNDGIKLLSAAVIKQAADDYKKQPTERERIERWLLSYPLCVMIAMPDADMEYIIRRFRENVKK